MLSLTDLHAAAALDPLPRLNFRSQKDTHDLLLDVFSRFARNELFYAENFFYHANRLQLLDQLFQFVDPFFGQLEVFVF